MNTGKRKYIKILIFFASLLLIILAYSNTFFSDFHFDDALGILKKEILKDWSVFTDSSFYLSVSGRPLSYLSFALNYYLHGYDVFGYHLFNILIHFINTCLVFLFSRIVFRSFLASPNEDSIHYLALFTALIFSLHPIQTQSVTYIVQRMTSLAALFYLSSILMYYKSRISYINSKAVSKVLLYAFLCLLFAVLALLSKQNAASLPLAILLMEALVINREKGKRQSSLVWLYSSVILIAFLVLWIGGFLPKETEQISRPDYLFTQTFVAIKYIFLLVLPVTQNVDHHVALLTLPDWRIFLALILHVALLGFAVYQIKRNAIVAFAVFWFYLSISIESSIIPIRDLMFEHRLYLATFGFSVGLVFLINHLSKGKKHLTYTILSVLLIVYALASYQRNKVWKDDISLWADSAMKSPGKDRPWCNLGLALYSEGYHKKAEIYFQKALRINPNYTEALNNMGQLYKDQAAYDSALYYFSRAHKLNPNNYDLINNYACTFLEAGKPKEAIQHYKLLDSLSPDYPGLDYNMALAYQKNGDIQEALALYNNFLKRPSQLLRAKALNNLGECYYAQKNYEKALAYYRKAVAIDSSKAIFYNNMGNALFYTGEPQKSISTYRKALKLDPSNAEAKRNLHLVRKWSGL